jgi:hypothetical protein
MNGDRDMVEASRGPCLFGAQDAPKPVGLALIGLAMFTRLGILNWVDHTIDRFCNGIFIVEENGFESLKSMRIDSPKVPNMQFKIGAMKSLTTSFVQILICI